MTEKMKVPFNKPFLTGSELEYMFDAVRRGNLSGDGFYTKKCSALLKEKLGAKEVLLTPSGTHALELAALAMDLKAGDEVIVPSFTFVSTPNAFMLRGAQPVFVDIRPDTKNIDERLIEKKITRKTKTIFAVHYAGVACEMPALQQIADKHHLLIVEDAAQAIDAKYGKDYLGTLGTFGCFSFHDTKNLTSGEGGALVINDEKWIERATILREKGTDRTQFLRGQVDKYTWHEIGSSFLLADILAAFLYAQLEKMEEIGQKRKSIYEHYLAAFTPLAQKGLLELPFIPSSCTTNYHMFYLLLRSSKERDALMHFLKDKGISAPFHYLPLHLSPRGKKLGYKQGDLPVTEDMSARLLRLPFYNDLSRKEQEYVISTTFDFFKPRERRAGSGRIRQRDIAASAAKG